MRKIKQKLPMFKGRVEMRILLKNQKKTKQFHLQKMLGLK
jgi:hypothetical protein